MRHPYRPGKSGKVEIRPVPMGRPGPRRTVGGGSGSIGGGGSIGGVGMAGTGDLHRLQAMLISLGRYSGIPESSAELFQRDFFDELVHGVIEQPLVEFTIGKGRVLDLTTIRFRFGFIDAATHLYDAADDLAMMIFLRFFIRVNGQNVMDQGATYGAVNQPKPPAGYLTLNRNVLGSADDQPAHLMITEGQKLQILYNPTNTTNFSGRVGVEMKGRWLTQKQYNDLLKRRLI